MITTRTFIGRRPRNDEEIAQLSLESQAALRQFSIERLMGYGLLYADAIELHARVLEGEPWQAAATALAEAAIEQANGTPIRETQIMYLRRGAALLRMSQMMMLVDSAERRAIFIRAADFYALASRLTSDRERVRIETARGPMTGWLIPARADVVGSAIVIGGVEGWAMDFDCLGEALAARGVTAFMLDGPGQGETRLVHQHYLRADWLDDYRCTVDYLARRMPECPIGFVGNSMGGSFAMAVAAADTRIAACVSNGGVIAPIQARSAATFFSKMIAFCGSDEAAASRVWEAVDPIAAGPNAGYPLLIVQGGKDPMVSTQAAELLLERAPTTDKRMVVFSDGDHCIYNHREDRDALIADWLRSRLRVDSAQASCD